ncbi:MAG TPA: tetratricopeptide repeat protein [Kofleriaceae bacterium]|nr:tetratricopeptide repeat protein [Kofleriaceae bacterium]
MTGWSLGARARMPRWTALLPIALLVAAALAAPRPAHADPVEERFAAAGRLLAEGRHQEAAAALEALAREAPDHRLAPEALFSAGEIREDRLAQPARALALYEEIVRAHPSSRPAVAAGRRARRLRAQIGEDGGGAAAQRRFAEIQQGFPDRPESESIAQAEALLREEPSWPGAVRVALWLAEIDLRAGRIESALRRYAEAAERWPDPDARFEAHLGAADAALRLGRLDDAERHARALQPGDDIGRQTVAREMLGEVTTARRRAGWQWVAIGVTAAGLVALIASLLLAARSPGRAARALWPPPPEVLYLAPVAALLAIAGYTDYEGLGPAVTIVGAAGLAVAWLSGAGLALRRTRGRPVAAAILHILASLATVAAVFYIAVYQTGLLTPVLATLQSGPDR